MRRPRHDPSLAIALVRVSTSKQELGPQAQRTAIRAWAEREAVRVVEWHEERVSGAADPSKRPGFTQALAAIAKHRAGVLVLHERSRLARDVDMAGYLRVVVRHAGAEIVTCDGGGSRIEGQIKDVLAEHERREIGLRTARALAVLREQGRRVSRYARFGFKFTRDGRMVPDPAERRLLARLRRLHAAGKSYNAIARRLNAEGVPPRRTARRWYAATCRLAVRAATEPARHTA